MRPIRTITVVLLAINAGIFIAYVVSRAILWSGVVLPVTASSLLQELDVDAEGQIAAWYSVLLLAAAGALAILTGALRRREGQHRWGWWLRHRDRPPAPSHWMRARRSTSRRSSRCSGSSG